MSRRLASLALAVALCAAGVALALPRRAGVEAPTDGELATLALELGARARLHPEPRPPGDPFGSAVFCLECHPAAPHPGEAIGAAMSNEHSSRFDCLVCHWTAEAGARPMPSWRVLSGGDSRLAFDGESTARGHLAGVRAAVTVRRPCFTRGPGCADCHRPGGLAGMLRPGSPPSLAGALERLGEHFRLPPGRKWYFPTLR